MKKSILLLAMLTCGMLQAQSDFDLTQRWFNESTYNPAAVGNSFTTGIFLHARAQWVGVDGMPNTQTLTFDTYANQLRSGFGVMISRDKLGYLSSYSARIAYAYYLPIGYNGTLAMGLSGGILNRNRNITDNMLHDPNDPALLNRNASDYAPEFDFGLEYKGPLKVGVAVRHLGFYNSNDLTDPSINVWAYISSRFNLLPAISIEPCFSYMYRNRVNRYEAGGLLYFMKMGNLSKYNDRFWIGAMMRFNGQFAVLGGMNLSKQIRIGYSFDYGTKNDLISVSKWGTHEIFVAWQLKPIFYKEPLCPAYNTTRKNSRTNKSLLPIQY